MGRWWHFVFGAALSSAGLVLAQETGPAIPTWELREGGRWQQVDRPSAVALADPTLDRVEEMLKTGQFEAARKLALAWLRANQQSPIRDRGLYLLGQANFQYGNRIMAFYNFDELMDLYPESRHFYAALERQYDIADAFLQGYKRRFLGMPLFEAKEEATEMLYRIQQRAPGSPLAERSLLRVADHYYATSQFDIAADAYAAYVRSYPRSPVIPRVRLRQAFSSLAQFRGIRFDATPVIDARQQLVDLMASYPVVAEQENIPALLQRIDAALARKLLETADFFRRSGKRQSEAYYYQYLLRSHPGSPEAEEARERLSEMPERVRPPGDAPDANPA